VARYAAESGIVAGRQAWPFDISTPGMPGLEDVPLGGARFSVEVTNLNGRLDLNYADQEALVGLFSQFTSPASAHALAAALQDWRDTDGLVRRNGAEEPTYARAGSQFTPRNGALTRVEELHGLMGMTALLARAVEPYVTVHGDGRIDVNAAPEPVLAALPGIGASGARIIVSRRGDGLLSSVTEVQALLGASAARSLSSLTVAPTRLLFTSRGWLPGHPLIHEIQATYAIGGTGLVLRSWRERDL
jgi:general secretion pathway protein K